MQAEREHMDFDVLIVGGGPAGLAAAVRLGQLAAESGQTLSVALVEKGAEIGAHVVSGAVLDPRAFEELFPDGSGQGAPQSTAVADDRFYWLAGPRRSLRVPSALLPPSLSNRGHSIISLGRLCQWLAEQAAALGVEVLPGFAASELLLGARGEVRGVITGDLGRDRRGEPKEHFQPGYELTARYVLFAEGCRGHLGKQLIERFALAADADPPHYALGFKEIWEIPHERHEPGVVMHTVGWPLDDRTDGGGFVYHTEDRRLYLGLVVSLGYRNPYLSPFEEFQRWKLHPRVRGLLEGGERVAYGARALNKGGWQSLPRLSVPGGLLLGCEAGFLDPARIKGTHTAMKSGMLAAETVFDALAGGDPGGAELEGYASRVQSSWLGEELYRGRNFSPALDRFGRRAGAVFSFLEQRLFRGRLPLTLRRPRPDHAALVPAARARRPAYPRPDGRITFDRLSSVYLSSTHHEEDQPCHLRLDDPALPIAENLPRYDEPAQRYCPAAVYEVVTAGPDGAPEFRINAANCIHCKACDIKDPAQNITWVPPEGGGGPGYSGM